MTPQIPPGIYPFWFWNGRLTADEIHWQVRQMAEQGIRGFLIHSRQGLQQPYLSASFFEMVDAAIEAAEAHGLLVHLYDEYPYPSGVAGGEVVLGQPQFHATRLVQRSFNVDGGNTRLELPQGKVLSAVAYPVTDDTVDWTGGIDLKGRIGIGLLADSYNETGLTMYNRKRFFSSNPTPVLEANLPPGPHRVTVSVQAEVTHHKYWNHYADVLNSDAISRFIDLTHERYWKRYADKFGKTIVSIFVDETAPGWSDRVPDAFLAEYGYDLCERLPALQDRSHPDHLKVAADLYRLTYNLFCETFETPISQWCRAHRIAYSGEKSAVRFSQMRYMDIPGCDPGHTKAGAKMDMHGVNPRRNARATASAAYFYHKCGALDECFHSMGWSATLQDAKLVAEGLLLNGISYLVPHGFFYTTHGLAKHDAPPTFFFQMPFWPFFGRLSERLNRIADLFQGTHIDAKILVVDPGSGLPSKADGDAYMRLQDVLLENHLEFLMMDTDVLQESRIEDGRICVRDLAARLVILPPMQVVEPPLQKWLRDYEAAGGIVIACDRDFDPGALLERIEKAVTPSIRIQGNGREIPDIHVVKRVSKDRTLWFALNIGGKTVTAQIEAGGELRELPLDDNLPPQLEKRDGRYARTVAPFESFLLESVAVPSQDEPLPRIAVSVGGPAIIRPKNGNLLRLYDWRMSLPDGGGQTTVVPAIPLSNQLEKGGFKYAPAYKTYFGHEPELSLPELRVRYETTFENSYTGPVELVIEPDSILGRWRIAVNDAPPIEASHFSPTDTHVRGSLGVDVTGAVVQGANTIAVEVTTNRLDGGLRNPLYLAGDFGVTLTPVSLTPPCGNGIFEAYRENRLPYYAGEIEYETTIEIDAVPQSEWALLAFSHDASFHEAAEISVNGGPFRPVLWQPHTLTIPTAELKPGTNRLVTRMHTMLIRSFEGTWFDYDRHEYRDVREGP